LGRKRIDDPAGLYYLELSMIHRWNKEAEHNKKMEQEARNAQHRSKSRR